MIVLAIGANLAAAGHSTTLDTCEAAVDRLRVEPDISVTDVSPWYETEPVPNTGQPWFINGAISITTNFSATSLMMRLHEIEASFGRVRRVRNDARTLDLDLIDFGGAVCHGADGEPILPHPRMHKRAFVLMPLADLVPEWRHPVTRQKVSELIESLPKDGPGIRRA